MSERLIRHVTPPDPRLTAALADPWLEQRRAFPDLVPTTPAGQDLLNLATRAYERHYHRGQRWVDLNPQVANHFLQILKAVLAAYEEG